MASLGPSSSNSRGQGREILDDISAAQQYVLDLQAAAAKAAGSKDAAGSSAGHAAGDCRSGATPATSALQQQIDDLTQQLETERRERARLQEQYDQAVSMLRKSYGQIVDDYLFATEQLHVRTKQLEGLMDVTTTATAAPSPASNQPRAGPQPAASSGDGEEGDQPLLEPQQQRRRRQPQESHLDLHPRQEDGLSEPWGSFSPSSAPGRASYGDVPLVEAPGAARRADSGATSADHKRRHRHVAAAADAAGSADAATAFGGDGVRTAPGSRSTSHGSNGSGGAVGGTNGAVAAAAAHRLAVAAGHEQPTSVEQAALPSQRSARSSTLLDSLRAVSTPAPGPQAARPQAHSPRAKARQWAPHGGGTGQGPDASPLSSPHGEALHGIGQQTGPPREASDLAPPQHLRAQHVSPAPRVRSRPADQVVAAAFVRLDGAAHREAAAASMTSTEITGTLAGEHVFGATFGAGSRAAQALHEGDPPASGAASPGLSLGLGAAKPAASTLGRSAVAVGADRPYVPASAAAAATASSLTSASALDPEASTRSLAGAAAGGRHSVLPARTSGQRGPEQSQPPLPGRLTGRDEGIAVQSPPLGVRDPDGDRDRATENDRDHGRDRERDGGREGDREQAIRGRARGAAVAPFADAWATAAAALRPAASSRVAGTGRQSAEAGDPTGAPTMASDPLDTTAAAAAAAGVEHTDSRGAGMAARAAASELGPAAAGSFGRRRWDVGASASHSVSEHRPDRSAREGGGGEAGEVLMGADEGLVGAAGRAAGGAAGLHSSLQTPPADGLQRRGRAAAQPDGDNNTHGVGDHAAAANGAADVTPKSGPKRLRRSVSSPAERPSRRTAAAAAKAAAADLTGLEEEAAAEADTASAERREAAGMPGSYRSSNRAASRPVPPAEPASASSAAAAAAAELRHGAAGPPSRRRTLRYVMSAPPPEAAPAASLHSPPTRVTRGGPFADPAAAAAAVEAAAAATPPSSSAAAAAAAAARSVAAAAPQEHHTRAVGGGASGVGVGGSPARYSARAGALERERGAASGAGAAPATPESRTPEPRVDPADLVRGVQLDLDAYLLRVRERAAAAAAAANAAAGAGAGVGVGAQRQDAAGLFGFPSDRVPGSVAAAVDGGGCSNRAAADVAAAAAEAAASRRGGASPDAAAAAAATPGAGGRSAAAAAAAATVTPAGNFPRGSGDGGSIASSASVEGLASLVRSLRQKLVSRQREYDSGADGGPTDDDEDVGVDVDLDDADGAWRTEDDDAYDAYSAGGCGDVGEVGDADELFLRAYGGGDGDADSAAYSSDSGQNDGELDDDDDVGNDVMYDTYDRLYGGVFDSDGVAVAAAARRSSGAAAAGADEAGRSRRGDGRNGGAPRTRARSPEAVGGLDSAAPEFSGMAWYGGSASSDSSAEDAQRGRHDYRAAAQGSGSGTDGTAAFWDVSGGVGGLEPGRNQRAAPAGSRRAGSDARGGLTSLLDAVNAATLGGVGISRSASRGGPKTAAAPAVAGLHQGRGAAPHDRAATATAAAAWEARGGGPGAGMGAGAGAWSAGAQPDRVPPQDQTSPRKDSGAAYSRNATSFKWKAGVSGMEPAAGASAAAAAAEADFGLGASGSFSSSRWGPTGGSAASAAAFAAGGARDAAAAAAAGGFARTDAADTAAAASPELQSIRSEAMFARIKKQLDELQSSFSQGLGLARGADGPSRAGSSGSSGGGGSGSGAEQHSAAAHAAAATAAAAAALRGDAWRASERMSGGSGGGMAYEAGASGVAARGAGGQGVGAASSSGEGGLRGGSFASAGSSSGEAAGGGGRLPLREEGAAAGSVGGGREAGCSAGLHGVGSADQQVYGEAVNASSRRSAAASSHARASGAGGSGAKPHGIVLHGEGDD
ncbi:hypothetical protein PLESTF_000678600 [Pleodorina starrii]|nr:hypothetical protein PLESTF_000678600 [Pleodorina starrii]